jgi:hypothetical protein
MAVTLRGNARLIVPRGIVRKAGLRPGDDDEYTPAQRRAILAHAKAGLKEIQQGKGYGPFATGAEVRTFVESAISKEEARKPNPS